MKIKYNNKEKTMLELDIDGTKHYVLKDNVEESRFKNEYDEFIKNGGEIAPYKTAEEILFDNVIEKKKELKEAKEQALTRPIDINGKLFYSFEKAYNEYKLAYEAGLDAGLTQGDVLCVGSDGKPVKTLVTEEELDEYFKRFRARKYRVEYILTGLLETLATVTDVKDLENIKWSDR